MKCTHAFEANKTKDRQKKHQITPQRSNSGGASYIEIITNTSSRHVELYMSTNKIEKQDEKSLRGMKKTGKNQRCQLNIDGWETPTKTNFGRYRYRHPVNDDLRVCA